MKYGFGILLFWIALSWGVLLLETTARAEEKTKVGQPFKPATRNEMIVCRDRWARKVQLVRNGVIIKEVTPKEFVKKYGFFEMKNRRGKVQEVARLVDILPKDQKISAIKIYPCVFKALTIAVRDIKNSPDLYVLGITTKDVFKMMKLEKKGVRPSPVMKGFFAIELIK